MQPASLTAVLLAAGRARRLGELSRNRPKCLLEVGGRPLIHHQLEALAAAGVREVVVVTGFLEQSVRDALGDRVRYVRNPVFDRTNSAYSLHLALETFDGPFLCTNADVLFDPGLLDILLSESADSALLYEPNEHLGDEEMKVRVAAGRVTAMAKTLPEGSYQGENLGVVRFGPRGHAAVRDAARRLVASGDVNAWAPKVFQAVCQDVELRAVSTLGKPWIEIDFPEDLERARREVWPRIAAAAEGRTAGGVG